MTFVLPEWASFLPAALPQQNLLTIFGILLIFGVLGGLLAARLKWLPTITGFMALGLAVGPSGLAIVQEPALAQARILVDIALGLILFRLGATIHPVKTLRNRRLVLSSVLESTATFVVITGLIWWISDAPIVALMAGAIAVSSSPAVLIHVSEELKAEGPAIDAAEELVAANNVLSFVLFSLALPIALAENKFDPKTALLLPLYSMLGAVVIAVIVAYLATRIAQMTHRHEEHLRFAIVVGAVMMTLGLANAFNVSTLFGGLALGIASRWLQGRSRLSRVEFGGGGDIFFVILFVFAGANLHVKDVIDYAPIALAFVVARSLAKVVTVYLTSRAFKQPHKQSVAVGLLLLPMAGLAIGLVQTTTSLVPGLGVKIASIVLAAVAIFETIGPPIAAFAIRLVGEAGRANRGSENGASTNGHAISTSGNHSAERDA